MNNGELGEDDEEDGGEHQMHDDEDDGYGDEMDLGNFHGQEDSKAREE